MGVTGPSMMKWFAHSCCVSCIPDGDSGRDGEKHRHTERKDGFHFRSIIHWMKSFRSHTRNRKLQLTFKLFTIPIFKITFIVTYEMYLGLPVCLPMFILSKCIFPQENVKSRNNLPPLNKQNLLSYKKHF